MTICCGNNAIFHDDYIPLDGYSFAGTGEAFIGDVNGDGELDDNELKQLIVMIICNVLLIICCIGVCYAFYKYNKKRSVQVELEQKTVELQANNRKSSIDSIGQTNIVPQYSVEASDPVAITSM